MHAVKGLPEVDEIDVQRGVPINGLLEDVVQSVYLRGCNIIVVLKCISGVLCERKASAS